MCSRLYASGYGKVQPIYCAKLAASAGLLTDLQALSVQVCLTYAGVLNMCFWRPDLQWVLWLKETNVLQH